MIVLRTFEMWIDRVRWGVAETTFSWALIKRINRIHDEALPADPSVLGGTRL